MSFARIASFLLLALRVSQTGLATPVALASDAVPLFQGFQYQRNLSPRSDTVNVTFTIYSGAGSCLLYQETQTGIDLSSSAGMLSLSVGSSPGDSKRSSGIDPGLGLARIFANSGSILSDQAFCPGGYTPQELLLWK